MLSEIQQSIMWSPNSNRLSSHDFLSVPSKACLDETPLKSALKKSNSQKPAPKSILKKSPFHGNISPGYCKIEHELSDNGHR